MLEDRILVAALHPNFHGADVPGKFDKDTSSGERSRDIVNGPNQERYSDEAFPNAFIQYNQAVVAKNAFRTVAAASRAGANGRMPPSAFRPPPSTA